MASTPAPQRPRSVRVRLARIAAGVIALDSTVEPNSGRGRWMTLDGREQIAGVVAAEGADGKVEVELHLDLAWPPPPIERVAELIRDDVTAAARRDDLGDRLGRVDITVHDLLLQSADEEGVR